jgi:hypothetical protein
VAVVVLTSPFLPGVPFRVKMYLPPDSTVTSGKDQRTRTSSEPVLNIVTAIIMGLPDLILSLVKGCVQRQVGLLSEYEIYKTKKHMKPIKSFSFIVTSG